MMYHKAILFNDSNIANKILAEQESPLTCKRMGRKVKNFDEAIWKEHAQAIVEAGVYLKFSQNDDIRAFLVNLEGVEIVEASSNDRVWGIGFSVEDAPFVPKKEWGATGLAKY